MSIDLNVERSHYWEWARPKHSVKWANRIPREIVDSFEAEGFITMHFEYRPEWLEPACRAD